MKLTKTEACLVVACIILFGIFCAILFPHLQMTPEEKEQYIADHTITYDVIYADRTTKTVTNGFGGVVNQYPAWRFGYLDENGELHEKDGFRNLEYGITKVAISEDDKAHYVIQKTASEQQTLYVPKKWLEE